MINEQPALTTSACLIVISPTCKEERGHQLDFVDIAIRVVASLANLKKLKPDPSSFPLPMVTAWSLVPQDHLQVVRTMFGLNELQSMLVIDEALNEARVKGLLSQGPFRYGMIERWFVRQMEPRARMSFKAPKAYLPSKDRLPCEIVPSFYALQEEFLLCIEAANGIDLSRTKVNNAVSRWFRLSLGQELAFNAAHERRHLWQARVVKREGDFSPLSSAT